MTREIEIQRERDEYIRKNPPKEIRPRRCKRPWDHVNERLMKKRFVDGIWELEDGFNPYTGFCESHSYSSYRNRLQGNYDINIRVSNF